MTGNIDEVLDALYDGVYFVDLERRITFWNQAAERITGFRREEVLGRPCQENMLRHIDDQGRKLCLEGCPLAATLQDGISREARVFLHHRDGYRVPVRVRVTPLRDHQGRIVGAAELFSDDSESRIIEARMRELEELALLDPLTRLPNRRFLDEAVKSRIAEMERYGYRNGLLFFDIDDFKQVNDRFGHQVGDEVLRSIAATLRANSRSSDVFGRWGGEEFLGVVRNVDGPLLRKTAEKLRVLVAGSSIPVENGLIRVTISLGATLLRPDDTQESAVERVDRLMYQSKQAGKNRVSSDADGEKGVIP